jgi:hypothetical protein
MFWRAEWCGGDLQEICLAIGGSFNNEECRQSMVVSQAKLRVQPIREPEGEA